MPDHHVLAHSHESALGGANYLTAFDQDVTIEFKGDFRDVSELSLNGTVYELSAYVDESTPRLITETDGSEAGTITKASALVTLPAAFTNKLADGTHTLVVAFTDSYTSGVGTASIVVDRLGKGTTPLTPPGGEQPSINPDGTTPHTGDSSPIVLVAVLASLGLLTLSAAVVIDRRKAARRSLAKGKR